MSIYEISSDKISPQPIAKVNIPTIVAKTNETILIVNAILGSAIGLSSFLFFFIAAMEKQSEAAPKISAKKPAAQDIIVWTPIKIPKIEKVLICFLLLRA